MAPSRRVLYTLAAGGWALLALVCAHVALESLARRVETRLDATLWGNFDEHRQLLVPSNHVGRGARRIMITGPSEAREGLLPAQLEAALPGWSVFQASLSMGVLSDVGLMLDYIERAYGADALPEVLVVGLTPRFTCGVGAGVSPLAAAIDEYSPHFGIALEGGSPTLVERGGLAGLLAGLRLRLRQGLRYRNAMRAARRAGPSALFDPPRSHPRLPHPFAAARYGRRAPWDDARVRARLDAPNNHFRHTAGLERARVRDEVTAGLAELALRARRSGVRLVLVELPERSQVRDVFGDEFHRAYIDAIRAGCGEVPLLELRELLDDGEFFDSHHPARVGALRLSERVGSELQRLLPAAR